MPNDKPKVDVYEEVTRKIEAALEAGTVPWRKPWGCPVGHMPNNPFSGTVYRGINPFLLDITAQTMGYEDPRWCTIKQANEHGGKVRKGEKSTLVTFRKQLRIKTEDVDPKTGEPIVKTVPLLRHYLVFNVEQVDGLDLPALDVEAGHDPIKACVEVIENMPNRPAISHGGDRAFYRPSTDSVRLPKLASFDTAEAYYGTAFHELVHATGHSSRLNRKELAELSSFGDEAYSREELTAEMGAAMLCGVTGISPVTLDQSAAYIAGWLRALKDDRKLLVGAAGKAQRAADFIRGELPAE